MISCTDFVKKTRYYVSMFLRALARETGRGTCSILAKNFLLPRLDDGVIVGNREYANEYEVAEPVAES